jgi:hypothetical protein
VYLRYLENETVNDKSLSMALENRRNNEHVPDTAYKNQEKKVIAQFS